MHSEINKIFASIAIVIFALKADAQTKVILETASQARAGSSTVLNTFIINQSNLTGPAKLSIVLPDGWLVENYPGETYSIKQSGNELKVIWLEFPQKDTVKVSALIDFPENQKVNSYIIKSELSYLQEGNKMKAISNPVEITLKKYFSRY
jgi:hypothetical protein